jgi:hypothetical protein
LSVKLVNTGIAFKYCCSINGRDFFVKVNQSPYYLIQNATGSLYNSSKAVFDYKYFPFVPNVIQLSMVYAVILILRFSYLMIDRYNILSKKVTLALLTNVTFCFVKLVDYSGFFLHLFRMKRVYPRIFRLVDNIHITFKDINV